MSDKKEVTTKVLKLLNMDKKGNTMTKLMVVQWNKYPPQLVKQSFYRDDDDGEWKYGKLKGFTAADFSIISKHHKEIKSLLNQE